MPSQASESPVLIVGAGPTGLTLALTLLKNGVPVRIIDKASKFHQEQRGAGIQPRTLEIFNVLGLMPEIATKGETMPGIRYYKMPGSQYVSTMTFTKVEEATPQNPFNNAYVLAQHKTEDILRSSLEKHGGSVELATELLSLQQYDDRVEATIKKTENGADSVETKSYRWIVGADGGKSTVRKQCGLSFDGESTEEKWIIGEIHMEGLDNELPHWFTWPGDGNAPATSVAMNEVVPGKWFFMFAGNIEPDKILASDESLKEALRSMTERSDLKFGDVVYTTDYRPSVRMVNKFSEGRVFVAGDAAHVHTPRGGQGLNSGVQDAFNLGWKIALVEKGLAPRSLLDTYNEERLPVIEWMLQETVNISKRRADNARDAATYKGPIQQPRHLKQFGINYRWSPIVLDERHPAAANEERDPYGLNSGNTPRAGDRAPGSTGLVRLSDGRAVILFDLLSPSCHTALLFGEDTTRIASITESLNAVPRGTVTSFAVRPAGSTGTSIDGVDGTLLDRDGVAYDTYGMTKENACVVIVRPDCLIGAIVAGGEGVTRYFGRIFGDVCNV